MADTESAEAAHPSSDDSPADVHPLGRGWQLACFTATALAAAITAWHVARAAIDVPFWDDFDSFLGFLIGIEHADGFAARWQLASAFHNEHRTFVGRVLVWLVHALGGSMSFKVLTLGSAAILMPILALVALPVRDRSERAGAVLLCGAFLFNLQHYENLFWGGAGLEHLGVVALALATLVLLHGRSCGRITLAGTTALLTVLTLAQGLVVIPAGAIQLVLQRRWRTALGWLAGGAVATAIWMHGYPWHEDTAPAAGIVSAAASTIHFWLGLLGAPIAFGSRTVAPWLGLAIVTLGATGGLRGWFRERPLQLGMLAFCSGALLLMALGRASLDDEGFMVSRYRILSSLVLALVVWSTWCRAAIWRHGRAWQLGIGLVAVSLMLEQAVSHAWRSEAYHGRRAIAAAWYAQHGTLEGSPVVLYYDVPKADAILRESTRLGIHDLATVGRGCEAPKDVPRPTMGGGGVIVHGQ